MKTIVAPAQVRVATLDEVQKEQTLKVLEANEWQMTKTATQLGINRKTLYRMLERWGVSVRTVAHYETPIDLQEVE